MKYYGLVLIMIVLVGSLVFLVIPGTREYQAVRISVRDGREVKMSAMGVMIDGHTVVSSAHVVKDNQYQYLAHIGNETHPLSLRERDEERDIALMSLRGGENKYDSRGVRDILRERQHLKIGETVYAIVSRSGSLVTLSGSVTNPLGKILGYTALGETMMLSGIVLTDIAVLPGDSGAPLFNSRGVLIDVVHVMEK